MAKKICVCKVCGGRFDRNSEPTVYAGSRRYAHQACMPEGKIVEPDTSAISPKPPRPEKTQQEIDMLELKNYIKEIYGDNANWALIMRQIKRFQQDLGFTLTGILKTLKYVYEVKKNDVSKSNYGIGIVEFTYKECKTYYYNIFMAQYQNKDKKYIEKFKEYSIAAPKRAGTKVQNLNWFEED